MGRQELPTSTESKHFHQTYRLNKCLDFTRSCCDCGQTKMAKNDVPAPAISGSSQNVYPRFRITEKRSECQFVKFSGLSKISICLFTYLLSLRTQTEAFSQGNLIVTNFEQTYCQSGLGPLDRGPVHYDLTSCGGTCSPRPAPRGLYAITTNTTEYSVDNVQVELRANGNRRANILGFAIVAISEDRRTVGRWVVDEQDQNPDVLRGTCDSLLEGQVIFHARPSNDRRRVVVTWESRRTNFGRVIFRAWVVQRHDLTFIVDSEPLSNPLDGRDFMSIESHFTDLVSDLRPPQPRPRTSTASRLPAASPTSSRNRPRTRPATSGSAVRRRVRPAPRVTVPPPRNRNASRTPESETETSVGRARATNTTSEEDRDRMGENTRGLNRESVPTLPAISIAQFEESFQERMRSGFDLNARDPFASFNEEFELIDLIPDPASGRRRTSLPDIFRNSVPSRSVGFQNRNQLRSPFLVSENSGNDNFPMVPWQAQGQFPGQFQGQFPGQFQGQFPGQFSGQFQGQLPGQFPGQPNVFGGTTGMNSFGFGSNFGLNGASGRSAQGTGNFAPNGLNNFQSQSSFSPWLGLGNMGAGTGGQNNVPFQNGAFTPNQQFPFNGGANRQGFNLPAPNQFSQFTGRFNGQNFNSPFQNQQFQVMGGATNGQTLNFPGQNGNFPMTNQQTMPTGFPGANTNVFGMNQNTGGFGMNQNTGGFGMNQNTGGFGANQNTGGFGANQNTIGGFANPLQMGGSFANFGTGFFNPMAQSNRGQNARASSPNQIRNPAGPAQGNAPRSFGGIGK